MIAARTLPGDTEDLMPADIGRFERADIAICLCGDSRRVYEHVSALRRIAGEPALARQPTSTEDAIIRFMTTATGQYK